MNLPCRHVHKIGKLAVRGDTHLHFHRAFAGAAAGPGEQRQRQFNHRGVKQIDLTAVLEVELLLGWSERLTTGQKRLKHFLKELRGECFRWPVPGWNG